LFQTGNRVFFDNREHYILGHVVVR
jgi:hypothetical protein